jgi:hypothetical protein
MSRVINITKVGKATMIEVVDGTGTPEFYMINQLTNVLLRGNVLHVKIHGEPTLFILYSEISDKLGSTDLKDYLNKAAALFLFNQ